MKWERKLGQFIGVLAIASLLGIIWVIFLAATLSALSELGAIGGLSVADGNITLARGMALSWLFLAAFALLTASNNVGATLQKRLRSEDLPLTQLRNALLEREAKMAEGAEEARH